MSRKHHSANEGITAKPAAIVVASSDQAAPHGLLTARRATTRRPVTERFWLEAVVMRVSRWLGSLQIAIILLVLFVFCLMAGIFMESWYDGAVAQQLVYRTWWFMALLGLLGVNIFFAAAKKCDFSGWRQPAPAGLGFWQRAGRLWPWRLHQIGFLVTHLGLLTMLAGGILNAVAGTDAMMATIDTDNPDFMANEGANHTTNRAVDRTVSKIRVQRLRAETAHDPNNEAGSMEFDFAPGPAAWRADEYLQPRIDALAGFLNVLTHPLPQTWQEDLGDGARLEVLGYYPHVRREEYGPARPGDEEKTPFPAIKLHFANPNFGNGMRGRWLAYHASDREMPLGPSLVQFLAHDCTPGQVAEFLKPPTPGDTGPKGQLVLFLDGRKYRFNVDESLNHSQPLGDTGWSVTVVNYTANFADKEATAPTNPAIKFELSRDGGRPVGFAVVARYGSELFPIPGTPAGAQGALGDLHAWYHAPDNRWGESRKAVLQLVTGRDAKIYYRAFNSHEGPFQFEKSGTVAKGGPRQHIWGGMSWKFDVEDFVPEATGPGYFQPENRRLGLEDEQTSPGIRCKLTLGKDSKTFWLLRSGSTQAVRVGDQVFRLSYRPLERPLPFEITLQRAEQTSDPGTGAAASYCSFVLLNDPEEGIVDEPHAIYMNHTLNHRGLKFFQSNYRSVGTDPDTKRPISFSALGVSVDPGLDLKYIGSTMLAVGISLMFYFRQAYIERLRNKFRPHANAVPN
jgi:hypothetical protein